MIHGTMAGHDGIGYSTDSPILDLAAAIVKAAVDDYVKTLRNLWSRNLDISRKRKLIIEKTELEEFFHSSWYEMLTDIDPDFLVYQCKILAKEKEKKAIERENIKRIKQKIRRLRDGAGEEQSVKE
jgi:hypothetical protein